MTLQSSGPISLSEIAAELGVSSSTSFRSMSSMAGFSTPDLFSDFYGYSAFSFSVSPSSLLYEWDGSPCGDYWFSVTANGAWYLVEDPYSEIYDYSVYPTSASGNETIYCYVYDMNYDGYPHYLQLDFYKTADDSWLDQTNLEQMAYLESCY